MSPGKSRGRSHVFRWIVASWLLLLLTGCGGAPVPPPGGRRLVIVAVDGATWHLFSPLMEQGRMPHMAGLYRSGSAGLLKSLEPMLPDALWTTVATGKSRGAHAIESATEKVPGKYAARPITADRRRSPALWTIAGARGLTVGVSGWAVTFPVEHVNGYMIAEGFDPAVTGEHGYL
ncbi:MAG TPA: alkaline phosphatase family protein, partial [Patescibacteria group bacterium]|nr:alkaline phosphatase family protein [Patescibacteria group bacterium]